MRLEAATLRDPARAETLEWLLADGLGGYASSTVLGLNTRRYHGLLVVATRAPLGRMVLLARLEESLVLGDRRFDLSTSAYPGALHPQGYRWAAGFALDPLPTLTWEVGGGRLSRTVARVNGAPGVVVLYLFEGNGSARLELRPLLAYRDHHALQHENDCVLRGVERLGEDTIVRPYEGCPTLALRVPGAQWSLDGVWYRRFQYARERERGLDFEEDLWSPGSFAVRLKASRPASLLAWAGEIPPAQDATSLVAAERKRLRERGSELDGLNGELKRAADAFVVRRGEEGRTILAGYHWFEDRCRDTMIALPGLCLATGRHEDARLILSEFARQLEGGLLPSRFPEAGRAPEYTSADAALWMVVAVHRYHEATHDHEFVRTQMLPAVAAILDGYRAGTHHGICMTADGLIAQGEPGVALTWMDARLEDWLVTPRHGYAVELQALWINALLIGADLARAAGDANRASDWASLASLARSSLLRAFWSEDLGYLADVVSGPTRDLALRPNQLYAIGLPHVILAWDKAARVLDAVRRELLTPVGLRTLARSNPAYRGSYQGDTRFRDAAYHQGTVWPHLMGVYFDALIRVHGEEGKRAAGQWLRDFAAHLQDAGLGFVSEVFDGDAPHRPGGAIALASSVGELLRVASRLPSRYFR